MIKQQTLTVTLDRDELLAAIYNYVKQESGETFDNADEVSIRYNIISDPGFDGPGYAPQRLQSATVEIKPQQGGVLVAAAVDPSNVPPNGNYPGKQSGYVAEFQAAGRKWECQAESGIRGLNWPCTVTVNNGVCKVTAS